MFHIQMGQVLVPQEHSQTGHLRHAWQVHHERGSGSNEACEKLDQEMTATLEADRSKAASSKEGTLQTASTIGGLSCKLRWPSVRQECGAEMTQG